MPRKAYATRTAPSAATLDVVAQEVADLVRREPRVEKVAPDADGDLPPDGRPGPHGLPGRIVIGEEAHAFVPGEQRFEVRHS
jgi:hypothetical protein